MLDLEKTDLKPPPGVKELKQLTMQARAAVDVALPKSPTMLELLAHNMGGHILQLEAMGPQAGRTTTLICNVLSRKRRRKMTPDERELLIYLAHTLNAHQEIPLPTLDKLIQQVCARQDAEERIAPRRALRRRNLESQAKHNMHCHLDSMYVIHHLELEVGADGKVFITAAELTPRDAL